MSSDGCVSKEAGGGVKVTGTYFASNGQLLVEETEELVTASLAALRAELEEHPAWSGAPPPTDDFLLMFLRAEMFSTDKAAHRYRLFWKVKVNLWGEERAHLPPKCREELRALKTAFIQVVPGTRDIEGRQVVLVNVHKKDRSIDRYERARAVWCVLLSALEDLETQKRGICFISSLQATKFSQIDPKFDRMVMDSIQGVLPLRAGSINVCYPPSFFRVAWAIFSKFVSKKVQERIRVIPGTDPLPTLQKLIPAKDIPEPMGPMKLDCDAWLAGRIELEG